MKARTILEKLTYGPNLPVEGQDHGPPYRIALDVVGDDAAEAMAWARATASKFPGLKARPMAEMASLVGTLGSMDDVIRLARHYMNEVTGPIQSVITLEQGDPDGTDVYLEMI